MTNVYWRFRSFFACGSRSDELHLAALRSEVYCPAPRDFNDPFDVNPVIEFGHVSIENQISKIERQIRRNKPPRDVAQVALARARAGYMNSAQYHQECREAFLSEVRNTPVLSLFRAVENPAMWAYYGDNGSGYAIGIDFSEPLDGGEYPLQVSYALERPKVDFNQDLVEDDHSRQAFLEHCFLTKATVWDKEEEYRLIFPDTTSGYRNLGAGRVSAICLGFSPGVELLECVDRLRGEVGEAVSFYKIRLCDSTYALRADEI